MNFCFVILNLATQKLSNLVLKSKNRHKKIELKTKKVFKIVDHSIYILSWLLRRFHLMQCFVTKSSEIIFSHYKIPELDCLRSFHICQISCFVVLFCFFLHNFFYRIRHKLRLSVMHRGKSLFQRCHRSVLILLIHIY